MGVGFIITSTGGSGLSVSYVGLLATKRVWKYSSKECDDSDDSSYDTSQFSSGRQTRLVEDFFSKQIWEFSFFINSKTKNHFFFSLPASTCSVLFFIFVIIFVFVLIFGSRSRFLLPSRRKLSGKSSQKSARSRSLREFICNPS